MAFIRPFLLLIDVVIWQIEKKIIIFFIAPYPNIYFNNGSEY